MSILTQKEMERLVESFLRSRGPAGATEEEIRRVVGWARSARVNSALLDLILARRATVDLKAGEFVFATV